MTFAFFFIHWPSITLSVFVALATTRYLISVCRHVVSASKSSVPGEFSRSNSDKTDFYEFVFRLDQIGTYVFEALCLSSPSYNEALIDSASDVRQSAILVPVIVPFESTEFRIINNDRVRRRSRNVLFTTVRSARTENTGTIHARRSGAVNGASLPLRSELLIFYDIVSDTHIRRPGPAGMPIQGADFFRPLSVSLVSFVETGWDTGCRVEPRNPVTDP